MKNEKVIEPKFWMIWVAGTNVPKRMHTTLESAIIEAKRLRAIGAGREVYVLEPVHLIPGRKLITLKSSAGSCKVEKL